MSLKNIHELARNPNLISGIHNYCDRWCERCPFTARCLVYATEEADADNDPASRDLSNAAFWKKLTAIFQETQEIVMAWAEKHGVDLTPETLAQAEALNVRRQGDARSHSLAKAAEMYARDVDAWFKNEALRPPEFSDAGAEAVATPADEDVNDYLEVIRWYQFFIAAKTIRGLFSRIDEDECLEPDDARDSDGSMKVALIAIDRSLSAWKRVGELRSDAAESTRKFLPDLEKLRMLAEREFPKARDFIRPGFDENLDHLN